MDQTSTLTRPEERALADRRETPQHQTKPSLQLMIQPLEQRLGADVCYDALEPQKQDHVKIMNYNQMSEKPDQAEHQRIGPASTYHDRSVY